MNQNRNLWLDDTRIRLTDLEINAESHKEQENVAGKTSGSDKSYQGTRPFRFNVSGKIAFKNIADFETLRKLYQAVDESGKPVVYKIRNITALAAGTTHVEFSDNISIKQSRKLDLWTISFILEDADPVQKKKEDKVTTQNKNEAEQPEGTTSTDTETIEPSAAKQNIIARLAVNRDSAKEAIA